MSLEPVDVAVVGAGPAAWAVAGACASRHLSVCLIGPQEPWRPTYGCWTDELVGLGLVGVARATLSPVTVIGADRHVIDRAYSVLDNDELATRLVGAARTAGVTPIHAPVGRHRRHGDGHGLTTVDGVEVRSRVVIDATGHAPALVWRSPRRSPVPVQSAFGIVARFASTPAEPGTCTLMDWRPAPGTDHSVPTFLYVLDLGDGWYLAEETALAAAPALSTGELRRRLRARLAGSGCHIVEQRDAEVVAIPMGQSVPPRQPVIGFGAAGGLVHPATGYSVIASLRLAPVLAGALADALSAGESGDEVARLGWDALWPTARRQARALQEYGLGILTSLGARDMAMFFDAFFELPDGQWEAYVDPVPELGSVVEVMRAVFARAPWSLRARLMTGDLRRLLAGSGLGRP